MNSSPNILVLGATGHLGRDVVRALRPTVDSVRIASRRPCPGDHDPGLHWVESDLATGRGLEDAVRGIHSIVFCAGNPTQHAAVEVDGMRRLLEVARKAGVAHFLLVSIVGIDRLPLPYYRTKLEAERLIGESGLPYTLLRATQFHYFVDLLLSALARMPFVLPVPRGFRVQPVATEDVAQRLVRCLVDGPRGLLKDFCGPEIFTVAEAAALWKKARGITKPTVQFPVPGPLGSAFREGHNTNPDGEHGVRRWSEWLDVAAVDRSVGTTGLHAVPVATR